MKILPKEKKILLSFFEEEFDLYKKTRNDENYIKIESIEDLELIGNTFPNEVCKEDLNIGEYIFINRFGDTTSIKEIRNINFEEIDSQKREDGFRIRILKSNYIKDIISDQGIGKEVFDYEDIIEIMIAVKLEELNS